MSKHFKPPSVQASYHVAKLVPKLKFKLEERTKLRNPEGPLGRLKILRHSVMRLFSDERIDINYPKACEVRGQAERLIVEAIRNGPCHRPTMEQADFWLEEKQLIHKLFKVLVPRFKNYHTSFTALHIAPYCPGERIKKAVLELKGNPFPSVIPHPKKTRFLLHNILLAEARRESVGEAAYKAWEESGVVPLPQDEQSDVEELSEVLEKTNVGDADSTKRDAPNSEKTN